VSPSSPYQPVFKTNIDQILKESFEPITLEQMEDGSKLMERFDYKTFFHVDKLPQLLAELTQGYRILTIGEEQIFDYRTLYFDTENNLFYTEHHNRHLNRYKVRSREYVSSGLFFLEVKFKNNKGKTKKYRIKTDSIKPLGDGAEKEYLETYPDLKDLKLNPALWVCYQRLTLVGKVKPERVTIDLNLSFDQGTNQYNYSNLVIMEVKEDRSEGVSPVSKVLQKHRLPALSISKYACGMATCYADIKKNYYKKIVQHLLNFA
jgi:VTC domain